MIKCEDNIMYWNVRFLSRGNKMLEQKQTSFVVKSGFMRK